MEGKKARLEWTYYGSLFDMICWSISTNILALFLVILESVITFEFDFCDGS